MFLNNAFMKIMGIKTLKDVTYSYHQLPYYYQTNLIRKERDEDSLSNCPVCLVGIVEPIGYVELKEGPLEFKLCQFPPAKKETITIGICSRKSCQHINMGAVPESLTPAKNLLKELILSLEKRTR
ncbi:hypothetical protein ASD40_00030 [Paenibacillus sp. Root444D2]|nr:hypothetical protein ASD40_00030 [Paenibacillus sp. Root444D2]